MTTQNPPRAVTVTVSPELLADLLRLPPGVKITGAMHDSLTQIITLRLDGPDFPTVIEGAHPMRAQLRASSTKSSNIDLEHRTQDDRS